MSEINPVAEHILRNLVRWKEERQERTDRWVKHSRTARMQEDPADRTRNHEKSQIKMPTTKAAITMAVDNLYQMLFSSPVFFDIKGRTFDDKQASSIATEYVDFLFKKTKLKRKMKLFLMDLCTFGTGIGAIGIDAFTEKSLIKTEGSASFKAQIKEFARPSFEYISIFDFFIEPHAASIAESEGIVRRKMEKIYKLKQKERAGYISGTKDILIEDNLDMDDDLRNMLLKAGIIANLGSNDVTLFEYWGWLDEDLLKKVNFQGDINDGGAEVVAEIANGSTLLRISPNPFLTKERPFVKENFEEIPGQFYGLGIPDIAEGPQEALDSTVRNRIDNKKLAINQVFGIDIDRTIENPNGGLYPGRTFFTRGNPADIIKALPIPDVTHGSHVEAAEFKNVIHEATGIAPILAGMQKAGTQTATEASITQSQSSVRLTFLALQIEEFVMVDVIRWFYQIALQFLDIEIIKVTNKSIRQDTELVVTPARIAGDFDFVPTGVLEMTNRNNFFKIMQFLTQTANQFDISVTDRAYLLRQAYQALGFTDGDRVFREGNGLQVIQDAAGSKGVGSVASPQGNQQQPNLTAV